MQEKTRQPASECRKLHDGLEADGYRAIFHASRDAIFVHALPDGRMIDVNQSACEMYGYSAEELMAVNPDELCSGEAPYTSDDARRHLARAIAEGPQGFEWVARRRNGQLFWVQVDLRCVVIDGEQRVVATVRDIDARKRAEVAEHKSRQLFESIFVQSREGIVIGDTAGNFSLVNAEFARMTGYSCDELVNMGVNDLMPEGEEALLFRRVINGKGGSRELQLRRKDGSLFDCEIVGTLLELNGEKLVMGLVRDTSYRKQAELALKNSEQKYRSIIENSHAGVVLVNDQFQIVYSNPEFRKITGYTKKEIGEATIDRFLDEESKQVVLKRYKQRQQGQKVPARYEFNILRKDGNKRRVEIRSGSFTDAYGQVFTLAQILDITEKWKSEQELKISRQKYQQLVDNSVTGIYLIQDFKIQFANKKLADMFGYSSPREMEGVAVKDLVTPESWEAVSGQIDRRISGKMKTVQYEFVCRRKDGSEFYAEVLGSQSLYKGRPAVHGTMLDISVRKTAELERARLATVVDQAVEAIIITDLDGCIRYANPAFAEISGYEIEEILGKNPRILSSGQHDRKFYRDLWQTVTAGKKWQGIIINKNKSGKIYYQRSDIFPLLDPAGKIINYAGIFRDITLERNLEEQLKQVQKMEAIGTLSGGVAHDFNNLLTVINGHAELAMMSAAREDRVYNDLAAILNAGKRAEKLTSQLLAFSRKQIHELKVIDLNAAITELDKMLRRLIPESIEIRAELAESLPFIKADPSQIEQITINLVVNARDAINARDDGGQRRILVSTRSVDLDDLFVINHPGSSTGAYILLEIRDTGVGMSEEIKSRIFEPFFTTKPVDKGTGLGLATVYGIVKQNNGMIYVDSIPGQGSNFRIYWPVTREKPAAALQDKLKQEELGGNETILFVEDDEAVRSFACAALRGFGYHILEAANGCNALNLMALRKGRVDLVVTDLIMPEMNGTELVHELAQQIPRERVIYVSGYTFDQLLEDGALQRGVHFVRKPYSVQDLLKKIRGILDSLQ